MNAKFDKRIAFVGMVLNAGLSTATHANEWYILNRPMHKLPNEQVLEHFREAMKAHKELAS